MSGRKGLSDGLVGLSTPQRHGSRAVLIRAQPAAIHDSVDIRQLQRHFRQCSGGGHSLDGVCGQYQAKDVERPQHQLQLRPWLAFLHFDDPLPTDAYAFGQLGLIPTECFATLADDHAQVSGSSQDVHT